LFTKHPITSRGIDMNKVYVIRDRREQFIKTNEDAMLAVFLEKADAIALMYVLPHKQSDCCEIVEGVLSNPVDSVVLPREPTERYIKTMEWLRDPLSDGGITTCSEHKGYGLVSDCGVCKNIKEFLEAYKEKKL